MSWYAFTLAYTKAKWPYISPNHRRGIAEALTDATDALIIRRSAAPSVDERRAALRWSYSTRIRDDAEPPADLVRVVDWLEANTVTMDAFGDRAKAAALAREMLARISKTKTGRTAAPNTINRKRMILNNAMEYAREIGALTQNPLKHVKLGQAPHSDDRRPSGRHQRRTSPQIPGRRRGAQRTRQAAEGLLRTHVLRRTTARRGQRTAPRESDPPPRATGPVGRDATDTLPATIRKPLDRRRSVRVSAVPSSTEQKVTPAACRSTLNSSHCCATILRAVCAGRSRQPPLRWQTRRTGHRPDLPAGVPRGPSRKAFTPAEAASPLLAVPYSLRHAAVSTWLRTSGDAAQVAEWAGHSVAVLLKVYAKCVHGTEDESLDRIWDATRG